MDETILNKLGIKIGHYTDSENIKGTSVFIAEKGAEIGIDVRGGNVAAYNINKFAPESATKLAHAVVLSGGSAFGLESIFGVLKCLEEQQIGERNRQTTIAQVTGAVIYDLSIGKSTVRPTKENGYTAAQNASYQNIEQGNIGVGTGAVNGKWFRGKKYKGGFGMATVHLPHDIIVSAFAVTNSIGDLINPKTGKFYMDEGGYSLNSIQMEDKVDHLTGIMDFTSPNTTLGLVTTNVALSRNQLLRVASMAHDGMARAVYPVHTSMDGDVIFALSSLSGERKEFPQLNPMTLVDIVGIGAADAMMNALKSSVMQAKSLGGINALNQ